MELASRNFVWNITSTNKFLRVYKGLIKPVGVLENFLLSYLNG